MTDFEFDGWMKEVDEVLFLISGVVSADLPDQTWRNWCEDGMEPEDAAREALINCE